MNKVTIFTKTSNFFYNKTKLWLVGLLLIMLVAKFMSLPILEEYLQVGENHISLDEPQIYSSDEVYKILTDWGDEGRKNQFLIHITWDLLLPVVYFFFLGFLIAWLTKRGFKPESKFQMLSLVSLVAIIDLLENITLFILILVYPANIAVVGWMKTGLTLIKYYLFGPAILFALIASLIFAMKNRFQIRD